MPGSKPGALTTWLRPSKRRADEAHPVIDQGNADPCASQELNRSAEYSKQFGLKASELATSEPREAHPINQVSGLIFCANPVEHTQRTLGKIFGAGQDIRALSTAQFDAKRSKFTRQWEYACAHFPSRFYLATSHKPTQGPIARAHGRTGLDNLAARHMDRFGTVDKIKERPVCRMNGFKVFRLGAEARVVEFIFDWPIIKIVSPRQFQVGLKAKELPLDEP